MENHFELPPGADSHFPAHGWAVGVTGLRQLRMPIVRLFQMGNPIYDRYVDLGLAGMWLQFNSPTRTIYRLAVALRDLHDELVTLQPLIERDRFEDMPVPESADRTTRVREGTERIEILLIATFTLLRRLADDITRALRPILFAHRDSAPNELKTAIEMARKGMLARAKPTCSLDTLADVLMSQTAWLDKLRGGGEGIRDVLVHFPHMLQVGPQGWKGPDDKRFNWEIGAQLIRQGPTRPKVVSVFPELHEILDGICHFMEGMYRCIGPIGTYERGDLLFLTGADNSVVGFWPRLDCGTRRFPMLE